MVLGELLTGSLSGAPASHSRGSGMGHLVTDSRFSVANPYSSWVRSTGPKGSLPFFEEKPWMPWSGYEPVGGPAFELLGLNGP